MLLVAFGPDGGKVNIWWTRMIHLSIVYLFLCAALLCGRITWKETISIDTSQIISRFICRTEQRCSWQWSGAGCYWYPRRSVRSCSHCSPSSLIILSSPSSSHRKYFSAGNSLVKPTPPNMLMHSLLTFSATFEAYNFAMAASVTKGCPASFRRAALYTKSLSSLNRRE